MNHLKKFSMSYSDGKGSPPLVNIYAYITNKTELQYAYITMLMYIHTLH